MPLSSLKSRPILLPLSHHTVSLPSRLPTAAPAIEPSRSHNLQPCEHINRPQVPTISRTPTPARDVALPRASYAATAAAHAPAALRCTPCTIAPCHIPTSSSSNAVEPHPLPRSTYPPLVAECLPNWTTHFRVIAKALGHAPNARPLRRGVIFLPETAEEFRVVKRCLTEAAAQDSAITWRCYGPAARKYVKVAIRGLPLETPAMKVVEALCALGYPAEAARAIPAPHGRPTCTYCVQLAHQTKEELRYLYDTTELLNMPNVSIEEWRERSGPSRSLRPPARAPNRYAEQQRRASTAPAQSPAPHTAVRRDAAAVPRDDAPSNTATSAATALSDAAIPPIVVQAETTRNASTLMANSNERTERGEALHGRRRWRRRAPRPARMEPPATMTPRPTRFTARQPIENTDRASSQARAVDYNEQTPVNAPRATDSPDVALPTPGFENIVRLVVEALTTIMAAYLREKGAIQI